LYAYSVSRYGSSPYIYPKWGLGGLPEGFSRLAAVHGGVYMLNKPIAEIVYDASGKVSGVKDTEGKVAKCKQVICDPSYVSGTDKIAKTGTIIRAIAIMSHPIPETSNADSCQIIIPYHQVKGRKSDIYIFCVSYLHKVVAENKWVAVISTQQESKEEAKAEIEPALKLLGKVDDLFLWTSDYYKPTSDGTNDQVFVSSSYDSCSHFEPDTVEVLAMYEKITGQKLDLSKSPLVKEGGKDDAEV
jgi:Rab GDP dissociation inhibitor